MSIPDLVDIVGDRMEENKMLDKVGEEEGNKILDGVDEWGEVDIVEDGIREKRGIVGEGGEGKMGGNPICGEL